ncbi:hypothetical protein BC826DRAFT_979488 [Russula brevipes]|nr:hypothetical protein BC826DRAFT_979488 [Russula brevipes]
MPPLSAQSHPSYPHHPPPRPLKRPLSSSLLNSGWEVSHKIRKQSNIETRMSLPPLPPVQSDATLAIFVHSSLKSPILNERFGDGDRLAFLGQRVLQMVVSEILFEKRPMHDIMELETELDEALSDESYNQWVTQYSMREKVACPANRRDELIEPMETRQLFNAYVGALFTEQGYSSIKNWIHPLVDPNYQADQTPMGTSMGTSMGHPPHLQSPRHLFRLEWPAVQTGPGHALTWSVECVVDGISKGRGTGRNKQAAKEEAARNAFQALGWAGALGGHCCAFS